MGSETQLLVGDLKTVLRSHVLFETEKLSAMCRTIYEELAIRTIRLRNVNDATYIAFQDILFAAEQVCANDREKAINLLERATSSLKRSLELPDQHLPPGPVPSSDEQ